MSLHGTLAGPAPTASLAVIPGAADIITGDRAGYTASRRSSYTISAAQRRTVKCTGYPQTRLAAATFRYRHPFISAGIDHHIKDPGTLAGVGTLVAFDLTGRQLLIDYYDRICMARYIDIGHLRVAAVSLYGKCEGGRLRSIDTTEGGRKWLARYPRSSRAHIDPLAIQLDGCSQNAAGIFYFDIHRTGRADYGAFVYPFAAMIMAALAVGESEQVAHL